MRDELNEPLGLEPPPPSPFAGLGVWVLALVAVAVLVASGVQLWRASPPPTKVAEAPKPVAAPVAPAPVPSASPSPNDVEMSNGVKVVRNGGAPESGLLIDVPTALGVRLAPAPDPRLVEKSRFGPLPRIGPDGAKPFEVYARPVMESVKLQNAPRVALFVGGLGLDAASTEAAIARLPAAVTLGFAPYGPDLSAEVAKARAAGHEVMLQAPMEPFAGGGQPGPHMLTTSASEAENRDSLLWMLGRFPGFIGVENYLGAKFTGDRGALAPVLAELASRGLAYLDDGSSPRSLALGLAHDLNLRAGAADVVIDASPTPDGVEAALTRLEGLARRQDGAIGVATALPVSLDHIARWAEALQTRGVALAPVSSLIARPPNKSGVTPP